MTEDLDAFRFFLTRSGERLLLLGYTKFNFTVDEGNEWLNPSREKNEGKHRRRKVKNPV